MPEREWDLGLQPPGTLQPEKMCDGQWEYRGKPTTVLVALHAIVGARHCQTKRTGWPQRVHTGNSAA